MASIYDKASLVLIPSGTKTSKVYSQKPTNGDGDFTFSRSTAATRVNASGNIEKETQNLALQSNSFNTSPWSLQASASLTSGQAGYDGTNNAWLLSKAADYSRLEQNIVLSGVWTFSCYAKAGTLDWVSFENSGIAGDTTFFNLNSGTLGTLGSGCIDSSIEDVGSGWYRCSVTISGTSAIMRIQPSVSNGVANGSNGNIYIQDAQLEQGLVARDYIETTTTAIYGGITDNVPRLDYTDSSCPALLLEPQRTNILINSEYFGGWSTAGGTITRTYNAATSPEGVDNATRVVSSSTGVRMRGGNVSVTSGEKWTYSIFAKENTTDSFRMRHEISANFAITFDLGDESFTGSGDWYDDAAIEDYGDGWYRCIVYLTADSTENRSFEVDFQNNDDLYFYGAQVEQGSYATSYIPTYGSAVTRNGESNAVTGVSSLIGQTQGTLFLEAEAQSGFRTFSICDGSTSNRITIAHNVPASFVTIPVYGGVVGTQLSTSYTSGNIKIAVTYSGGNYSMFVNGTKINSASIGTFSSTLNKIEFAQGNGGNPFAGDAKQALVFPTALTDQEAIDLTTL